jgi:transposase-like protein
MVTVLCALMISRRAFTVAHTTNANESLNAKLRRSVRIRGHFPNDEAAMKLI